MFGIFQEVPVPWKESSPMSERLAFIQACLNRREHLTTICARFGVSEKTGHKWLARFREGGEAALLDRSHAPVDAAHRVDRAIAAQIVALRKKHPLYGPAKLHDLLVHRAPGTRWPAVSTIGELLKREGLVRHRRRRAATHARLESGRTIASSANVVWTADFKGQFRVGSGEYCYPLTVLDLHHHYLLGCIALSTTAIPPTRRSFARLFAAYGLPKVIRTDNGVPFAQPNALGRLGALAYWWVRLGIRPEHTRPATPSENGAHERFQRTLKAHTTHPVGCSLVAQQRQFDRFETEYNTVRPHESTVDHRPPGYAYVPSQRPYSRKLPPLEYAPTDEIRLVDRSGVIKWRNHRIFLSTNLQAEHVALTEIEEALVQIRYASLILGDFDLLTKRFTGNVRWDDTCP
jgi:transposase InsO family protein